MIQSGMMPLLISICGSVFSLLILGGLVALIKRFFKSFDDKFDQLFKSIETIKADIQGIMLEGATNEGSQNTRFALIERDLKYASEKITKLEGSNVRLWSKVDPKTGSRGGNNE